MSFILDALKKVEQDKRRPDGAQIESIAVSRARFGQHRHLLSMAAIALISASLTAAAVWFLSNNRHRTEATATVALPESEARRELDVPPLKLESPVVVATNDPAVESPPPRATAAARARARKGTRTTFPRRTPRQLDPSHPTRRPRACPVRRFEHRGLN